MTQYLIRRLLSSIPVLFGVAVSVFFMVHLLPGDVVTARLAEAGVSSDKIAEARAELGLDRPLYEQFFSWLGGILRGDFGDSLWTGRPVLEHVKETIFISAELGFLALAVGVIIAIPMGVISAIRPNSPIDYTARLIAVTGLSVPDFFLGVLTILLLSRYFDYFPPIGIANLIDDPLKNLEQLWLPILLLGFRNSAAIARMTRSTLLEILRSDYIRTAQAKGLRERVIVVRHALKNALIPVVTIMGSQAGAVIAGTVVMEVLFVIPGMGQLTLTSVTRRDFTQLQINVLIISLLVIVVNLLVDISYSWLDPRIRYR